MKVLKFGGSSLSTPSTIRQVGKILLAARRREPLIVVVSAFEGVTNRLLECARLAEHADPAFEGAFEQIARRHRTAVTQLVTRGRARVRVQVDALLAELRSTLQGIHLLRHCPVRALDMTASFGERLSALIVAAYLARTHPAAFVDARDFLVTDDQFTHANVIFKKTNRRTRAYFSQMFRRSGRTIPIVTGFIGATEDGQTTTIGRNGSDYSAAIVGSAVGASVIEIWTDVDGVLSADPRVVPAAFVLPQMTYEEAMELSYFGARVLHSSTIAPAVAKQIPLVIRNTFNPSAPGTVISRRAVAAIEHDFQFEMRERLMELDVRREQAIVAVVGEGMKGRPGVAGKVFDSLGRQNINISAIAQGASERNISCVIDSTDQIRALNAIHQGFFETRKKLALAVVGVGNVGGAVLRQLHQQRDYLLSKGFDVTVVGLANSTRFVIDPHGVNLSRWKDVLLASTLRMHPESFARALAELELTNAALVDCTVGPSIVDAYAAFIDANFHIITPNKWANALPWRRYAALLER